MSLVEVHDRLANTALFFAIIMVVWGFFRFFRRQGLDGGYWGAVIIAELLFVVQGLIGLYLWLSGAGSPPPGMHILYGVVIALAIPIAFSYTRGRQERPEMLIYGVAFLILIGLVLRAMVTAV